MIHPRPPPKFATSLPAYPSNRTANGRAQRASARNLNSSTIPPSDLIVPEASSRQPSIPPLPDSDPFPINHDFDELSISRATSAPALDEPLPPQLPPTVVSNGRGRPRKDKGKGKETEKHSVKIKEEPMATYSLSPDPSLGLVRIWSLTYDHTPHYCVV